MLAGDKAIGRILAVDERHHLPLIVIGEYQFGLLASRKQQRYRSLFRRFEAESIVLCSDRATADWYAGIRHELKRQGTPIPENDVWIAALARQHSLEIVSNDHHFDHVRGIRRIAW